MTTAIQSESYPNDPPSTAEAQLALAIDSLSEHVVLFDAEDRIIFANKAWRELNSEIAEHTRPGTRFEDHLRALLEKGLVPEASGREEDWLRERMERHLDPDGPFEVARQDGQWVRVHEQRLPNNGTILIVSDITGPKRLERALRESEELLSAVVNNSPAKVHIKDAEGRYILINSLAEELFGVTKAEARGKTSHEIFHKAQADAFAAHDREVLEGGKAAEQEEQWQRVDGVHTYLTVKFPTLNSEGEIAGIGAIGTDITDRKRVEEALRKSEARFQDFAESGSDWLWEMDSNLRFSYFSDRLHKVTGIPCERYIGMTRQDVGQGAIGDADWQRHLADLAARRPFRDFRYTAVTEEGTEYYWSISGKPLFDDEGNFLGYRGTGTDITGQKRAEDALRQNERRLGEIIESLPVAFHLWGPDERLVMCNENQIKWFPEQRHAMRIGAKLEEHIRVNVEQNLVDYLPGEEEEYIRQRLELFRNPPEEMGEQIRVGDRWLQVINKKLPDGSIIGIRLDITASKQAEDQLHQAQKMEAVGQLTGGVAHDFNNLLAVIMGNAELLMETYGPENRLFKAVVDAASRGSELTQRLLSFSRKQALRPQLLDLNVAIAGMTDMLCRSLGETIEIETAGTEDLWACLADPGQLENALLNLALNARDAMPGGGKLIIQTANVVLDDDYAAAQTEVVPGNYIMLAVRDTGTGMSTEVRAHAFEPFYTTKAVGAGSGLGLSMVYGFAKQSGGHVSIDSEPGDGTTIKLYLPRCSQSEIADELLESTEVTKARGETILVVEDDPEVRSLAVMLLDSLGYRVKQAATAPEALELLGSTTGINLILTDVVLAGGMNGRDLGVEAGRRCGEIKLLYMSGYAQDTIGHHGRVDADIELLQKPFRKADLARAVRQVLDG